MSATNGNGLHLDGPGGAYLRVSGDRQDTERQYADLGAFEAKYEVKVAPCFRYEDDMPRDLSDKRLDFQRMLRDVRAGRLRWIWVQRIDRFGFADEWELAERLMEFRKAGCKLYDAKGDEWTADGLMSFFKAGLAGHESHGEQVEKSFRSLDGMVKKAKAGEWQGGPPKLGFDVGCFDKATNEELWRIVWEGREKVGTTKRKGKMRPVYHIRRLKVYPDGSTERLDGNVVSFRTNDTQVMRIVPTRDAAKREAAQGLFGRYATESVSFYDLAMWLNDLGIRNSFGERFQGRDIEPILSDAAYLGYPTFAKNRAGRFHRYANGQIEELPEELKRTYTASNPADVIRGTRPDGQRWYDPLVDRAVWDAVAKKLSSREKAAPSPRSGSLYLSGLLVCAVCGKPMYARKDRSEYFCSTYHHHLCQGRVAESPCLRNAVGHAELEGYVNCYLEETGKRLELLTQGPDGHHLTDHLTEQGAQAHQAFLDGIERLCGYLAQHHPDEYSAICQEYAERAAMEAAYLGDGDDDGCNASWVGKLNAEQRAAMHRYKDSPPTPGGFVDALLAAYRSNFDADALAAEVEKLEAEHTAMMRRYADLPTPRAREKAKAELAALEARIAEIERQGQDMAGVVEQQFRQVLDLQRAVRDAKDAMSSEEGERSLRQRAEALRGLLVEIRCEFVVTGKGIGRQPGPGEARSRLSAVTFLPIAGDARRYPTAEKEYGNSRVTEAHSAAPRAGPARNRRPE